MSKRIVIDATVLCLRRWTKGGQQRYTRELLLHLGPVASDDAYVLWFNFVNPANLPLYRQVHEDLSRSGVVYRTVRCLIPPQLMVPLRIPVEVFTGSADVFHAPTGAGYWTRGARQVVTIHDLAYFDHPECFAFHDVEKCKRYIKRLADRSAMILTVSDYARGTIIERLGVPPDRVRTIYHGVSKAFLEASQEPSFELVQTRFGIRRPYVLFVSTIQPNKNVIRLLEAFDLLRHAELRGWQLVLAGQPGWLTESIFAKIEVLSPGKDVVFTGFVEEDVLPVLYRHAEVFVLPSLVEGFGIPIIEAMACGAPVVVSKSGALPEIAGDAGVLVDPYSVEDIARGILTVATDPPLRDRLIARGKARAVRFRWEETARETAAAYRDAAMMT